MYFVAIVIVGVIVFLLAHTCTIEFLDPREFGAIAARQRYFRQMTAADLRARAIPGAPFTPESYLEWYRANALAWSWNERTWIYAVVAEAERAMQKRGYAHMVPVDNRGVSLWRFAKVAAAVEQGFPHTHADVIVWSEDTLREPFWTQVQLAVHEAVHIWQRQNPEATRLRHTAHGFRVARLTPAQRRDVAARRRNNPDTDLTVWQRDGLTYTSCYRGPQPTSLTDVEGEDHPHEEQAYRIAAEVII